VALELESPAGLRVGADPAVFRLVLLNLLNNALEACSPGDRVTVAIHPSGSRLELVVTDTGAGMSRETLERVTELFFSTKPRGSGIGLALVDRVVREAGGRLLIDSEPGQGTTVRVIIPVEVVSA
jgi:signal transduction histidine kinase